MSTAIAPAASSLLSSGLSNSTSSSSTANSLFGATSGSSSSGSSGASSSLDAISQQVAALDLQAQQSKITTQGFEKDTHDLQIDNRMTARSAGILQANTSRLNVFSALDKNDTADFFTFTVATGGATKFSALAQDPSAAPDVRYQILNSSGTVIADSQGDDDQKAAYSQLNDGTFNLDAGKYVIRVSRVDDSKANQANAFNYAVQLSQGLYKNDYDLVEKSVDPTADPFGLSSNSAVDALTSAIASSVTDMQNLPPIGTSATDKLMGVFTSLVT